MKKRADLEQIMEENNRKIEEAQKKLVSTNYLLLSITTGAMHIGPHTIEGEEP
jgi:hypothetical protein